MTPRTDPPDGPARPDADPADLDGHTIDELGEYLDRGRIPFDPSIEASPGCQLALQSMERLHGTDSAPDAGNASRRGV